MVAVKSWANDFWKDYAKICNAHKLCPLNTIMKQKETLALTFSVEFIRAQHCPFILKALTFDKSLNAISISSDNSKVNKVKETWKSYFFPDPFFMCENNLLTTCCALGSCLKINQNLKILKLEKLPLSVDHVKILSEGLKSCTSLLEFSLAGCPVGDNATELLFETLKHIINIQWVNVSSCDLSVRSALAISSALKFQFNLRLTGVWEESLRYSKPVLDKAKGIDRISLNDNRDLGDRCVEILREALIDDLWLKALDIQNCNIGANGATEILRILKSNCVLELLDLRHNDIPKDILEEIDLQLRLNNNGKILKYMPLSSIMKNSSNRKASHVHRACNAASSARITVNCNKSQFKIHQMMPHENRTRICSLFTANKRLTNEVEELKEALKEEKMRHMDVQMKLVELQTKNKMLLQQVIGNESSIPEGFTLIDNSTYISIQNTFEKFSNFLKLLRETGFQDLLPSALQGTLSDQLHDFK